MNHSRLTVPRKRVFHSPYLAFDLLGTTIRGNVMEGDQIGDFEQEFGAYTGTEYALSTASGRAALYIILKALDLKEGDEAIIPAYTFSAVVQMVLMLGLKPVFVDIDHDTLNIDPNQLGKKLSSRTKVILATHIMGQPCDIERVNNIAEQEGIFVIEDCAESPGAEVNGRKVGSFGGAGFFSFETVKPINTFGGGMIVTNDGNLAQEAKRVIRSLPPPPLEKLVMKIAGSYFESVVSHPAIFPLFVYPVLRAIDGSGVDLERLASLYKKGKGTFKSFLFQYTNLQAHVGRMQLRMLDARNERRRSNASLLKSLLEPRFATQVELCGTKGVYYIFTVKTENKEEAASALLKGGIDTGKRVLTHCPPLHGDPGHYPASKEAEQKVLQIPVFDSMGEHHIDFIARTLNKVL